jgi:hypothetical protein
MHFPAVEKDISYMTQFLSTTEAQTQLSTVKPGPKQRAAAACRSYLDVSVLDLFYIVYTTKDPMVCFGCPALPYAQYGAAARNIRGEDP